MVVLFSHHLLSFAVPECKKLATVAQISGKQTISFIILGYTKRCFVPKTVAAWTRHQFQTVCLAVAVLMITVTIRVVYIG